MERKEIKIKMFQYNMTLEEARAIEKDLAAMNHTGKNLLAEYPALKTAYLDNWFN